MNIIHRQQVKAFAEHFTAAMLLSELVIAVDLVWLTSDAIHNGLRGVYIFVGLGLITAMIGTGVVIVRHYKCVYRKLCKKALEDKVLCNKRKLKHKRK